MVGTVPTYIRVERGFPAGKAEDRFAGNESNNIATLFERKVCAQEEQCANAQSRRGGVWWKSLPDA